MSKSTKAKDVETYIATSAGEARPKLQELREVIRSTVPDAEERISYGVPFYKYHGELAGFAAYRNHVSFGFGADVLEDSDRKRLELAGYALGKGTMQIRFEQELPITEIEQILKHKAEMNEARRAAE